MIPVFRPSFGEEELEAVRKVFESGWIGLGPKVEEFEEAFATYVGAKHAVAVNSGTAALHLSLLALGIGPGDEVLVPTLTFISTAQAVSYCGAKPVFVDVYPTCLDIDLWYLPEKISEKIRAVVPVHYGGHPARMERVWSWAHQQKLIVIEDAAHACGSEYKGKRIGGLESDATCFSFHAVKNLACGDGGMITTNDEEIAQKLRRLRWCGIDKTTWDRTSQRQQYGWEYKVAELGYKCHMNDITAAIGLVQLGKLDAMNLRRREIVCRYDAGFTGCDWIETPVEHLGIKSSWHNYVVKVANRDGLHLCLKSKGVATGVHYMPLHLQPYYYDPEVQLPVAEAVWMKLLTLPVYPDLTDDEVDHVVACVKDFWGGRCP